MPYSRPGMAIVSGTTAYVNVFIGMSVRSTMKAKNTPMHMASSVEPTANASVLPSTLQVVGLVQA